MCSHAPLSWANVLTVPILKLLYLWTFSLSVLLTLSSPHPFTSLPLTSPPPPHTALVKKLIEEIDQELFQFFEGSECKDYLFCHRYRS